LPISKGKNYFEYGLYCLLAAEEQAILAQISVFAGGFTLEDAEAVCDAFDVLESLEELRRHSFFRVQTDGVLQQTRFLLLESLREYALEKLAAFPDAGHAIRHKHAGYFLQRTRERLQFLRTPQEGHALQQLNLDYLNLRAAVEWTGDAGLSLRHAELALVLSIFLLRRGSPHEACGPLESGLAALQPQQMTHPVLYAELLRERAGLHFDLFEWEAARIVAEHALALFESVGETRQCALTCNILGEIARKQQDFTQARHYFRQALDYFERQNAEIDMAIVQNNR
jgi:tetratricopeptide (TPR) repeat protein